MKESSDQLFMKLMRRFESLADPRAVEGMARYGIVMKKVYGIPSQVIRRIAKEIGTKFAWKKAVEWSKRHEEFVKRAGYVLMAALAVHDKQTQDTKFLRFLPLIRCGATDERNFVKKAVNWALRQIGKRSLLLNKEAIRTGKEIHTLKSPSARWIASDAC